MVDEALLHQVADEIYARDDAPHVAAEEIAASIAFAKNSGWTPALSEGDLPGVEAAMKDPRLYIGYGIVIGLEAARRSS